MASQISWSKRARVTDLSIATFKRYRCMEAPYVVIFVKSKLGLPSRWLACRRDGDSEVLISRHRRKERAIEACEKHWSTR